MSVAGEKPAVDAILQKVMDAVPFQLTTDGGAEAARQRFRDLPRADPYTRSCTPRTARSTDRPARLRSASTGLRKAARRIRQWWSSSTAAAGRSATSTPTTARPAATPSGRTRSWCRSTTGWRRNIHIPRPSKMSGPQRNGSPSTPANWAPTPTGWPSRATRQAAIWRRWWRNWPGTRAGRRFVSSCCGTRRRRGTPRCRRSPRTPNAPILGGGAVQGILPLVRRGSGPVGHAGDAGAGARREPVRTAARLHRRRGPRPAARRRRAYAELLTAAGVPVELHNAETLVHGYLGYAGVVPAATEATERGLSALRRALHPT